MKVEIINKNQNNSEKLELKTEKEIEEKLLKLKKYFNDDKLTIEVKIRSYNIGHKIEIKIPLNDEHIVRQEIVGKNIIETIDIAIKRIEKQIQMINNRANNISGNDINKNFDSKTIEKTEIKVITKRKKIKNVELTEEEALLQFELMDHNFFVFKDKEDQKTKILYKKYDSYYGIIELT